MNLTDKTNAMEPVIYPYWSIAAKLSTYVETKQNVRLITSFASVDPNRDRANLLFLKQFGVVPQDQVSHFGEIDIRGITNLDSYDGLTIIFESIAISDVEPDSILGGKKRTEKLLKSNAHRFYSTEMKDMLTEDKARVINHQIHMLSSLLEIQRQNFRGGYIYISGFSCMSSAQNNDKTAELGFLPWYFELGNMKEKQQVITQPELDSFLDNLEEQPPLISNLDDLLDSMVLRDI